MGTERYTTLESWPSYRNYRTRVSAYRTSQAMWMQTRDRVFTGVLPAENCYQGATHSLLKKSKQNRTEDIKYPKWATTPAPPHGARFPPSLHYTLCLYSTLCGYPSTLIRGVLHSRSSEPYKLYVYGLTSFGANVTAIKASSLHWRQKENNNSSRSAQNHDKMVDKSKKQYFTFLDDSLISEIWKTCNG